MQALQTEPSTTSSSARTELVPVPPQLVEQLWPIAEPLLERSVRRSSGRLSMESVREGCIRGIYTLWLMGAPGDRVVAAALSEVLHFASKKVFSIFVFSGDRKRCESLWPTVGNIARGLGCAEIQIAGPRAWRRWYPEFKEAFTVFTRGV